MKKVLTATMLSLCLTMTLGGCGGNASSGNGQESSSAVQQAAADETTEKKDTFTVAYRSEAANLDPHNNQSLTAFSLELLIYDRLVDKDSDGNIVPALATEWEEIDDTTIRFHLRDDAYFHNGEKVTAEDVKYTIERAETMPGSRAFMNSFDGEGTTVVDEYTVDIKLHTPFAPIFNYLASARGCVVCKSEMEKVGSDTYGRHPIGSGPLVFSSWTAGDSVVLTRNDNYWGEKTAYSKFVARFISEAPSRAIELETGGVDVAMHVASTDVARLEENPKVTVYNEPGYTKTMITLNQNTTPVFEDVRVREALYEALDIEGIVAAVYPNTAVPAYSTFSTKIPGYKQVGQDSYNPDHAKELLAEANWDSSVTLPLITSDLTDTVSICEIVRNMWEQVGVKVEIVTYDSATFNEKVTSGDYVLEIAAVAASSGDPDHALLEWKDENLGYKTPDNIKELIVEGNSTYDMEKRNEIYEELQELCWAYHAEIPIAYQNVIYGTGADVINMDTHPGNVPNFARAAFK